MVPPPRIELGAEHYHCSVLPLNYGGMCNIYNKQKAKFLQVFTIISLILRVLLLLEVLQHCHNHLLYFPQKRLLLLE